ncbi:MAG TPA: glycosyl hydrolase family 28-related protein, partial [Candidatus Acidoferrum sp.]|nr:glycosyl hydrolase family 28-related protein [Candidatus Acidoferrum sp.]
MSVWVDGSASLRTASFLEAGSTIDAYRSFNVRADGTDQITKLQNAQNAARDAGPGAELILPPGTITIAGTLLLDTSVKIRGAGEGATILKQADNSNLTGLVKTRHYDSLAGGTTNDGETRFEISHLILDGNKTNNASTATDGLQIFGYRYSVHDIGVRGFLGNGINAEWGTPGSPTNSGEPYALGGQTGTMQAHWNNIRTYFNAKSGMVFNGPNDTIITNLDACMNAFYGDSPGLAVLPNVWIKSKAAACVLVSSHVWNGGNYGFQFDAGVLWLNCEAEGAHDAMVYVTVPVNMVGGFIFASAGMIYSNKVGIKFGASGSIQARSLYMTECSGGYFDFTSGGGGSSYIDAFIFGAAAQPLYVGGTPSQAGVYNLYGLINGEKPSNLMQNVRRVVRTDDRTDYACVALEDDFLPGSTTSGSIGDLGWT